MPQFEKFTGGKKGQPLETPGSHFLPPTRPKNSRIAPKEPISVTAKEKKKIRRLRESAEETRIMEEKVGGNETRIEEKQCPTSRPRITSEENTKFKEREKWE